MIEETQRKGLEIELHCLQDLTKLCIETLMPVQSSSKYDVVADINGKFIRIQCKHSTWCTDTKEPNSAFYFATCRMTINTKEVIRYTYSKNDIDYFYTWFEGHGYLIPIEEATGKSFRFRYEYPNSGQKRLIHLASDYEIEKVILKV